jgi:hypothetical protein
MAILPGRIKEGIFMAMVIDQYESILGMAGLETEVVFESKIYPNAMAFQSPYLIAHADNFGPRLKPELLDDSHWNNPLRPPQMTVALHADSSLGGIDLACEGFQNKVPLFPILAGTEAFEVNIAREKVVNKAAFKVPVLNQEILQTGLFRKYQIMDGGSLRRRAGCDRTVKLQVIPFLSPGKGVSDVKVVFVQRQVQ